MKVVREVVNTVWDFQNEEVASLLLDELLNGKYMSLPCMMTIRKTGSTATTAQLENYNHLAGVVLIEMLKLTEAD